jgi:hypothetical protein
MKYLQSGGFEHNPLMRHTISLALLLLAGCWATNIALYFQHMTLDPASVVTYFRGNDAEFVPARSAAGMLEVTHMHLPMFALVLLLLTHLLIFAPMRYAGKVAFVIVAFGSALLSEAAGWMTRFWHPGFAVLKVSMFVVFQATLGYLIFGLGAFLLAAERFRRSKHAERVKAQSASGAGQRHEGGRQDH